MKSILVIGASSAGKSSTMSGVCKKLNPSKVYHLKINREDHYKSELIEAHVDEVYNNTYVIEVNGKLILVCAGAPTEQNFTITIIIDVCIKIGIDISFAIVSMRSFERKNGFDTLSELGRKSTILLSERIYRIADNDYKETAEWKNRIDKIVKIILENI